MKICKVILLFAIILICGNSFAQCLCGRIRFAIDDEKSDIYNYRYWAKGKTDTLSVSFINNENQVHSSKNDSTRNMLRHESYGRYDKKGDSIQIVSFDNKRNYLNFHIDYFRNGFVIEAINTETKEVMTLDLDHDGFDISYNLLTKFVTGKFGFNITRWQRLGEEKEVLRDDLNLEVIESSMGDRNWIKIHNIEPFRIE